MADDNKLSFKFHYSSLKDSPKKIDYKNGRIKDRDNRYQNRGT